MTTTRTEQDGTIRYAIIEDGATVSFLDVEAGTRKVINVETVAARQGEGLARLLWETANAEAECYHDLDHHRTPEGDAFARAMGGETIDAELGYCEHCCICND